MRTAKDELVLTIRHELPGRLRVKLSHPLLNVKLFEHTLRSHEGIEPLHYTPALQTLLVRFHPDLICREELLIRSALAVSLQYGNRPVKIASAPARPGLSASVAVSGTLLLLAVAARATGLRAAQLKRLEWLAGFATGSAVIGHAIQELKQQNAYHPEVLSVLYLIIGMSRGNSWRAAMLTWFASFGRHFFEFAPQTIEVRPRLDCDVPDVTACAIPEAGWRAIMQLLPSLLRTLMGAGRPGGDLLGNLKEVSRLHDQVLDALGPWRRGIPLHVSRYAAAVENERYNG